MNYIVGENGVGKRTILKLICALYPVTKGNIIIDGQNIQEIRKKSLRDNVSIIFSDPYLFDASIYENIGIGNLNASKEDIIRVAKEVNIHELVKNLEEGYNTCVGENGVLFSSGEKQKIALARALLKNSPIILLDEVTKSIDTESRISIHKSIKKLENQKTIIIVTHNAHEIEPHTNTTHLKKNKHIKKSNFQLKPPYSSF